MTVKIKKFTDRDIGQIIILQNEWFESGILPSFVNCLYEDDFSEKNTIVAVEADIIGYSLFSSKRPNNEFEIEYLYISKSKRGRGIGEKLIESVEKEIKNLGGQKIVISPVSTVDLGKLMSYYRNLGYSQEEDRLSAGIKHKIMSKVI